MLHTQLSHVHTSLLHLLTVRVYMHVLLLSSRHHCPYYMYYCFILPYSCYMIVSCYCIHVIWLFPVTDMDIPVTGHESCWYAICGIPHLLFPFPVILFPLYCSRFPLYCSMLSTELRSSYHVTRIMYLFLWHCILDISDHKANLGIGETWRLIRSYRVDVWIHCLSHCRGRVSAGYRLLLMSIPLLF